jgi:hypothetical protein
MKKLKLILGTFLLLATLSISCKKESTDTRPQFVGTWTGTVSMIVPGLNPSNKAESLTITTGTGNSNQLVITQVGSTVAMTAVTNGNTYKYDEYTQSASLGDVTVSMKFNGTGTLNGNVLSESGTVTFTMSGVSYPGTWSSTLNKQ